MPNAGAGLGHRAPARRRPRPSSRAAPATCSNRGGSSMATPVGDRRPLRRRGHPRRERRDRRHPKTRLPFPNGRTTVPTGGSSTREAGGAFVEQRVVDVAGVERAGLLDAGDRGRGRRRPRPRRGALGQEHLDRDAGQLEPVRRGPAGVAARVAHRRRRPRLACHRRQHHRAPVLERPGRQPALHLRARRRRRRPAAPTASAPPRPPAATTPPPNGRRPTAHRTRIATALPTPRHECRTSGTRT